MNTKIFVMRHQSGGCTNLISKYELEKRTYDLYNKLCCQEVNRVYTCFPMKDHHIRSLQTATNLCTLLSKDIRISNGIEELPKFMYENTLIVWHHSEMDAILKHYGFHGEFTWPSDNYDGCLILYAHGWEFDPSFFENNKSCFMYWI